jgi:hypothetical protein
MHVFGGIVMGMVDKKPDSINISRSFALYGQRNLSNSQVVLVTYHGEIGRAEPLEMRIDLDKRALTVVFNNGLEKKLGDIPSEKIGMLSELKKSFSCADEKPEGGFYQVTSSESVSSVLYDIPVKFL